MSVDDTQNDAIIQPSVSNVKTMLEIKGTKGSKDGQMIPLLCLPVPKKKPGRPAGLTRKAQCFLEHLIAGKSPREAYQLAGYNGKHYQLPYKLKYQLKDQLFELLQGHGISKEGVYLETKKLLDLPLQPDKTWVTFDEKMALLRFIGKLIPQEEMARPKITPFVIAINNAETVVMPEQKKPEEAK